MNDLNTPDERERLQGLQNERDEVAAEIRAMEKHTGCPECATVGGHRHDCIRLNAGAEVERLEALVAALETNRRELYARLNGARTEAAAQPITMSATAQPGICTECGADAGTHFHDCARLEARPNYNRQREIGRQLAASENERDEARAEVRAVTATLTETSIALSVMRRERDAMRERCAVVCEARAPALASPLVADEALRCAAAIRALPDEAGSEVAVGRGLAPGWSGWYRVAGEEWTRVPVEDAPDSHQEPRDEENAP